MPTLAELLGTKPSNDTRGTYTIRIDGPIKAGKSTLALTASKECPHPSKWKAKTPVTLSDILWIQTEKNALEFARVSGINVEHMLDWSDPDLTVKELRPAIRALPEIAKQFRDKGIKTVVFDTLSTFNRRLIRDIPDKLEGNERIRSYGEVMKCHMELFDALQSMRMNVIGLVHLVGAGIFGEEGGTSAVAQAMKAQAEKAIDKLEAMSAGGFRPDFKPAMYEKAAAEWGRHANAIIVMDPQIKVTGPGQKSVEYKFVASPGGEAAAASRWNVQGVQDAYLRPLLERFYGEDC